MVRTPVMGTPIYIDTGRPHLKFYCHHANASLMSIESKHCKLNYCSQITNIETKSDYIDVVNAMILGK